jgi:hypothetical protein
VLAQYTACIDANGVNVACFPRCETFVELLTEFATGARCCGKVLEV